MHENVGRVSAAGEEPEPARANCNHFTCARPSSRVAVTETCVSGDVICVGSAVDSSMEKTRNACRPPRALQHFDHDARALIGNLETTAPQARNGQKNVGHPIVGTDDAIALRDVERFDDAAEFDDARGLLTTLTFGLGGQSPSRYSTTSNPFCSTPCPPTAAVQQR